MTSRIVGMGRVNGSLLCKDKLRIKSTVVKTPVLQIKKGRISKLMIQI